MQYDKMMEFEIPIKVSEFYCDEHLFDKAKETIIKNLEKEGYVVDERTMFECCIGDYIEIYKTVIEIRAYRR